MYQKRRSNRVNSRAVHNLCPNCFSTVEADNAGNYTCTGDKLVVWQQEAEVFLKKSPAVQKEYLSTLGNASGFLSLLNIETGKVICGFSSKIGSVVSENQLRIPDPMAVTRLERKLQRSLSEEELEEGYTFEGNFRLPFLNFPDDV